MLYSHFMFIRTVKQPQDDPKHHPCDIKKGKEKKKLISSLLKDRLIQVLSSQTCKNRLRTHPESPLDWIGWSLLEQILSVAFMWDVALLLFFCTFNLFCLSNVCVTDISVTQDPVIPITAWREKSGSFADNILLVVAVLPVCDSFFSFFSPNFIFPGDFRCRFSSSKYFIEVINGLGSRNRCTI